jgi:hypothetical protein
MQPLVAKRVRARSPAKWIATTQNCGSGWCSVCCRCGAAARHRQLRFYSEGVTQAIRTLSGSYNERLMAG